MSASCKKYEKLLSLYLDARLDTSGRAEVDRHLATCEACRATIALLSGAAAALAAEGPAEPPPGLAARAARGALAAGSREARPSFIERWIRVAWPTAAAASVATALLLFFGLSAGNGNGQAGTSGDPVALIAQQSEPETDELVRSVLAMEEE